MTSYVQSFFYASFYFLFGVLTTIYFVLLFNNNQQYKENEKHSKTLYLNIFILNSKDILVNVVRNQVSRKQVLIRALAKRIVPALINDHVLAKRIGLDICEQVTNKLNKLHFSNLHFYVLK